MLNFHASASHSVAQAMFTQPPLGGRCVCFTGVFFCFFSSATIVHKYKTTVLENGWTDFHEILPNDSVPKWGLGPQIIFGELKTTQNESELVYAGSVLYGGCVTKAWMSECI